MSSFRISDLREAKNEFARRRLRTVGKLPRSAAFSISEACAAATLHVHGVGIGRKRVAGKATGLRCVRVHVLQKLAESLIPQRMRIPKEIDGIPTDVVVSPPAYLLSGPPCGPGKQQQRPVRPGVGISGPGTTAGTLGCIVRDRGKDPRTFLLTCSHVLVDRNSSIGEETLQPAQADGGSSANDAIAELARFTDVFFATDVDVDAAIAAFLPGVATDPTICGMVRPQSVRAPRLNIAVRMSGHTSSANGLPREGFVAETDLDTRVYLPSDGPALSYKDQFRIEPLPGTGPFSAGGDSGAVILESGAPAAIGLLVGGDLGGTFALATPLQRVLDRLDVSLA
jgi:hypothetical protein